MSRQCLVLLAALWLAPVHLAVAQTFNFESQFSSATNNSATTGWSYRYQSNGSAGNTIRDGDYELLADFFSPSFGLPGLDAWHPSGSGSSGLPTVGKNITGATIISGALSIPAGQSLVHPNPGQSAIVTWTAPAQGTANVTFSFTDLDNGGGDGIRYFVERNKALVTLSSGTVPNGGASGTFNLNNLKLAAGDRLNFVVDPNVANHFNDSTRVSANINFTAGGTPFNTYRAAADLKAFETGAAGVQPAVNGSWSYGTKGTVLGAFTPFAAGEHGDSWAGGSIPANFQGWFEPGGDIVPAILTNMSATPATVTYGATAIDPNQMLVHGGENALGRNYADTRWTAPKDGVVDLWAQFVEKHTSPADVAILLNDNLLTSGISSTGDGTVLALSSLLVRAGDRIDFLIGTPANGSYGATSTGFDAEIRLSALTDLPEPGSFAAWTVLSLVGAGLAWRRARRRELR